MTALTNATSQGWSGKKASSSGGRMPAGVNCTAGVCTLALLGVSAQTMVRTGDVRTEISGELTAGGYDLLVVGAPLSNGEGQGALGGVVGELLTTTIQALVLVVRSAHTTEHALRARFDTRSYTEVIR